MWLIMPQAKHKVKVSEVLREHATACITDFRYKITYYSKSASLDNRREHPRPKTCLSPKDEQYVVRHREARVQSTNGTPLRSVTPHPCGQHASRKFLDSRPLHLPGPVLLSDFRKVPNNPLLYLARTRRYGFRLCGRKLEGT